MSDLEQKSLMQYIRRVLSDKIWDNPLRGKYSMLGGSQYSYNPVSEKALAEGNMGGHVQRVLSSSNTPPERRAACKKFLDVWDILDKREKAMVNAIAAIHESFEHKYTPRTDDGVLDRERSRVGWRDTGHHDVRVVLEENNVVSNLPDALTNVREAYKAYRSYEESRWRDAGIPFSYGSRVLRPEEMRDISHVLQEWEDKFYRRSK